MTFVVFSRADVTNKTEGNQRETEGGRKSAEGMWRFVPELTQ